MLRKSITLLVLLVAAINAGAAEIAVWEFTAEAPAFVTYVDDYVGGLRAQVLSKQSGASVFIDKGVCCGALSLPNTLSDAATSNIMLTVADTDTLTGHANGTNGFNSLTIEIEFKPQIIKQSILIRKTQSNTADGYHIYMTADGKIGFQVGDGVNTGTVTSRNPVKIGQWHKVIATWENRFQHYNTQVILDGVVSRASTTVGTLTNTSYPLTIGGLYREAGNYGQFFSGDIKEVRISTDKPRLLDAHGKNDPLEYIIPTGKHLETQNGFVKSEFIYDIPSTPECHASTIVDLGGGKLAAAWMGGTCEGHIDFGAWYSRYDGVQWTTPVKLASGPMLFPQRDTIFNPVLFKHSSGRVFLFYKVGTMDAGTSPRVRTSDDNGLSWSGVKLLPEGISGATKNKPVELPNGDIVSAASGTRIEISSDIGNTWRIATIPNPAAYQGAIQPTILIHSAAKLQALLRTQENKIAQSFSYNGGSTWSNLTLSNMPNNNSGIDAVTLADGRHLLVYNHSTAPAGSWGGPRTPLNVAISADGINWQSAFVLEDEPGEYSYPAVIQTGDGLVHITYTWQRLRVKHIVLNPRDF